MMRLTKSRTMSLGSGSGTSTAILSTAVLSTQLGLPNPVSSMQQYNIYLPIQ